MCISGAYTPEKKIAFLVLIWKELNAFSSLPKAKGKQQYEQRERQVICQLLQHVHHLVDMLCILKGGDLSCCCTFSIPVIKCQSWCMFPPYIKLQTASSNKTTGHLPSPLTKSPSRGQHFCNTGIVMSLLLFCSGLKAGCTLAKLGRIF